MSPSLPMAPVPQSVKRRQLRSRWARYFIATHVLVHGLSLAQAERPQPYVMHGTETVSFTSAVNAGQEYVLYVHLPQRYASSTERYPVIYVLDGQWDFTLVTAIYGQQYYDGFVPASIIVGITWGGKDPRHDSLRARDLTPFHHPSIPQSGNAATFLKVLTSEVFPLVESRYRAAASGRTLMGSSFGGLFTLYALFTHPKAFEQYVLTSPAIGWADARILATEAGFARSASALPARVFMAHGELEGGVPLFETWVNQISSRAYSGFRIQSRIIEGAGHSGGKAEGFTRGLQWVFALPDVELEPQVLDAYAGEYEIRPSLRVKLWRDGTRLMAQYPGGPAVHLRAASGQEFYLRGVFLKVRFTRDVAGVVTGLTTEEYGRTTTACRIR